MHTTVYVVNTGSSCIKSHDCFQDVAVLLID